MVIRFRSSVALMCVLVLCIGWYYGLQLKHIKIGDVILAEKYKLWAMASISSIVLLLCAGNVLLWIVIFSTIPILLHATLHIPMSASMSKKDDDHDPENPMGDKDNDEADDDNKGPSRRLNASRKDDEEGDESDHQRLG